MSATEIEVIAYYVAGTAAAAEFTVDAEPLCCQCGAPLRHVFVTDRGAMGGDCLASLTGDDSTRAVLRRVRRFEGAPCTLRAEQRAGGLVAFKLTQNGSAPMATTLRGPSAVALLGWARSNPNCRLRG